LNCKPRALPSPSTLGGSLAGAEARATTSVRMSPGPGRRFVDLGPRHGGRVEGAADRQAVGDRREQNAVARDLALRQGDARQHDAGVRQIACMYIWRPFFFSNSAKRSSCRAFQAGRISRAMRA
jgi:hypothetical protein